MNHAVSEALAKLERIQQLPVSQLAPEDWRELHEALSAIRAASEPPGSLALPASAWELIDQTNEPSLELLFARRIVAQHREYEHRQSASFARLGRSAGSLLRRIKTRSGQQLRGSRFHPLYLKLCESLPTALRPGIREYEAWRAQQQRVMPPAQVLHESWKSWSYRPRVSILLGVRNTPHGWLEEAVRSVREQIYGDWELCICDDHSDDQWVRDYIRSLPHQDERIRVVLSNQQRGESGAFNEAATMASGEYVTFLDHDDRLAPEALYYVVESLQAAAAADVLYTDEEFIDEQGQSIHPHFKPAWSARLLDCCMYFGHLVVVRRQLFEDAGRFRGEFDGAQDFDLVLRVTEQAKAVLHIPKILYQWRMHSDSTAADVRNKPRTHRKGKEALESAIVRRHWTGTVVSESGVPNLFFTDRNQRSAPSTGIILVHQREEQSVPCEELLQNTASPRLQWILAGYPDGTVDRMGSWMPKAEIVMVNSVDTNHAAELANRAARASRREILIFVHDRLKPATQNWIDLLIQQLCIRDTGIAGAKIVTPPATIEHAGIALGIGDGTGRIGRGVEASRNWLWLDVPREVSAVDAMCLAIRRELFEELGGFDLSMAPHYHAIDLCLRARRQGYAVVIETRSVLSVERPGPTTLAPVEEWVRFLGRWWTELAQPDPYFSPNLRPDVEDPRI
jgi:glycosyltransferase involved in cell wall biosynthesis